MYNFKWRKIFTFFGAQQYTSNIFCVKILFIYDRIIDWEFVWKFMDESFVKQLTLSQKVRLVHGDGNWHTHSENGLPVVMMTDGPHGLRKQSLDNTGINDSCKATCFPTSSAIANSWNRTNAALVAQAIAEEALSQGVSVVLGPGVNIKRSPLCGRNFEYFSEDPLLAGEMGVSYITSMQNKGIGCCVKHFAVNSQETDRLVVNSVVDERALREIYLAAFEQVVKQAQPYCVMAAYNKVNGISCTENKVLLTDILRDEWGFDGLVMSDWGAAYDMAAAYTAGMDLEMPDGGKFHEVKTLKAVGSGELKEEYLDRAVANVARLADKCITSGDAQVDYAAHHRLCRKLAADSAVLLKNNGILPLKKDKHVLVVGEFAEKPRFQGSGSSHVNATCKSFLDVLREEGIDFTYTKGYSLSGVVDERLEFDAARLALKYDTVLFFGGLTDAQECEGYDRTHLNLAENQLSVLYAVTQHNPNVIFVAYGGAPFATDWLGQVKALLLMNLGGEAVTEAAYDLLFGDVSPSGRLAETYPIRIEDTPCYKYFATPGRVAEYRESIYVGYRYYNTFDVPVRFPFGYGLSYSVFDYSNLRVEKSVDGYDVTVNVSNIGTAAASEVVQIYVDSCDCGYMRAKRVLAGFEKVYIESGANRDVTVHVDMRAFSIYLDGSFRTVHGKYKIAVCKDVEHVLLNQYIDVEGENIKGNDRKKYPSYYERRTQVKKVQYPFIEAWNIDEEQFYALAGRKKRVYTPPKCGQFDLHSTLEEMAACSGMVRTVLRHADKIAIRHSPTRCAEDPVAKMMSISARTTPLISLMSVGGVKSKYVMFLLHWANKKRMKALAALNGRYDI